VGLQIIGRHLDDPAVLRASAAYEAASKTTCDLKFRHSRANEASTQVYIPITTAPVEIKSLATVTICEMVTRPCSLSRQAWTRSNTDDQALAFEDSTNLLADRHNVSWGETELYQSVNVGELFATFL